MSDAEEERLRWYFEEHLRFPFTDQVRAKYKLGAGAGGVVVTAVAANSSALEGGLAPGDLILRVQQTPISTPADASRSGALVACAISTRPLA